MGIISNLWFVGYTYIVGTYFQNIGFEQPTHDFLEFPKKSEILYAKLINYSFYQIIIIIIVLLKFLTYLNGEVKKRKI